jgi:hypothetical protein
MKTIPTTVSRIISLPMYVTSDHNPKETIANQKPELLKSKSLSDFGMEPTVFLSKTNLNPDLPFADLPRYNASEPGFESVNGSIKPSANFNVINDIALEVVRIIIFGVLLSIIDVVTDIYTIHNHFCSSSPLMNKVALGLITALVLHNIISSILITKLIHINHTSSKMYARIWGSFPRKIVTITFHLLGLGDQVLNIDMLFEILAKNRMENILFTKQSIAVASGLLHVMFESLPQAVMQAGAMLLQLTSSTEQQCFYTESDMRKVMHAIIYYKRLDHSFFSDETPILHQLIPTMENSTTNCTCVITNSFTPNFQIYCEWEIINKLPYISVAASTISVVWAVIHQGYACFFKKNIPHSKCSIVKTTTYISGLISGIFGLSLGIYLLFVKSMSYSPLLLLLLPLLLLRICPPKIFFIMWGLIFRGMRFPTFFPKQISKTFLFAIAFVSTDFFFSTLIGCSQILKQMQITTRNVIGTDDLGFSKAMDSYPRIQLSSFCGFVEKTRG